MDTFIRPECFIQDHFADALTSMFSKGALCGTSDHIDTEVRGDSAQESKSTSNSMAFGCEAFILLFVDAENSLSTQLY